MRRVRPFRTTTNDHNRATEFDPLWALAYDCDIRRCRRQPAGSLHYWQIDYELKA